LRPHGPGRVIAYATSAYTILEPPRLIDIRVDGDTAVAVYSDGHRTRLRELSGRWLIDSL
jgi:hypothetical protein